VSTPVPLSQPGHPITSPAPESLPGRVAGVLRAPRATLAAVVRSPRWVGVLLATLAVTFACNAALLETEVGRLALVDRWERTALAFGQTVDDARYAAFEAASENGALYAAASALASGPLLTAGLSALLFAVFNRRHPGTRFVQVLAVVAHAGVILALRQVVAAPLNYSRETLASPTTATVFFSMFDESSALARFFGIVDLFIIWWVVVVALVMSVLYRRPARPLVAGFIGAYVVLAALLAGTMALAGGTA
jgi:hypothetical protein